MDGKKQANSTVSGGPEKLSPDRNALENNEKSTDGRTSGRAKRSRELLNADHEVPRSSVKKPHHEWKDGLITWSAIAVISIAAVTSAIGLLAPLFLEVAPDANSMTWPEEMLRLALVSSLAFVMGSGTK